MVTANVGRGKPRRLVAFDVEGVLLPARRYLLFEAARKLGFRGFVKIGLIGVLYEMGLLSLESALRRVYALFRGFTVDGLFQLFKGVPLIPGVRKAFEGLNAAGYRTVLISSGLPTPFVEELAARLKADYAIGLGLEVVNGRITGRVGGDVVKPEGKALVLNWILEGESLSPKDCVVVADDRNNLSMFPLCALGIGYNPDFIVSAKADFVVKGDLSETLPLITEDAPRAFRPTLSKGDVVREAIHIGGFLVPFICMYLLKPRLVSLLILLVTLLYGASELARLRGASFPLFSAVTWRAATKPEVHGFVTAPIFFALGIVSSLILFPVPIGYASVAVLVLGDGCAMIFGKGLGRTVLSFNKGKRVEGSLFGFLFAFMGASLFVGPVKALMGAAVGMLAECLPSPVNDNVTIPLASGLAMMMPLG